MKTKQHDYTCSFLLRPSHSASYFLKFSLPCFNIAALKSSPEEPWYGWSFRLVVRKGRIGLLGGFWNPLPGIVGKMVHMCVHAYFLKRFAKGSWFPKSWEPLERSYLGLRGSRWLGAFPIPTTGPAFPLPFPLPLLFCVSILPLSSSQFQTFSGASHLACVCLPESQKLWPWVCRRQWTCVLITHSIDGLFQETWMIAGCVDVAISRPAAQRLSQCRGVILTPELEGDPLGVAGIRCSLATCQRQLSSLARKDLEQMPFL